MLPDDKGKDKLVRIRPDQILCKIDGCAKPADFLVYRRIGDSDLAVYPYCESHAKWVAADLRISDEAT